MQKCKPLDQSFSQSMHRKLQNKTVYNCDEQRTRRQGENECVKLWNEVLQRVKALPKKGYKREIRGILFKILINENDYIETSTIVKKKVGLVK